MESRFGLGDRAPRQVEPLAFPVWPELWSAVLVFEALFTQWQPAPLGGPVGLRYESIPVVLRLRGIPRAEWAEIFESLRVMERAALALYSRRAKRH